MEQQSAGPARPSTHERARETTSCCVCDATIGPRERRLTWRVRDGADVFEYHYCSDACFSLTNRPSGRRSGNLESTG
ncbi:hypothetical protein [Natronolimnohabitans innermongolicus]|uniref:TRASH domain-containing protein n=1 Tax=Natronolimnohabitans innermongolicus JCM 12255 TaxID=1227499 RepID=L9WIH2_9EURY|nr:hypothetical protein [Natronolimnohabitans innermongolicus]ELY49305.1 hypothetical protein C493_20581 [Natronolimnohabitans innermongolicus JCM 12255]